MTNEAVSPLRRRMIEDMTIRRLSPKAQQDYIRTIKSLTAFLGRSPDKVSFEDIRRFQLHVAQSSVGTGANCDGAAVLFQGHAQAIRHRRAHGIKAAEAAGGP
jgi:hypothetical protein